MRHRLSEIDPDSSTGTCAICGPGSRLRFRKHRDQWACWTSDRRKKAETRLGYRLAPHGMTHNDYAQMLAGQLGGCAICGDVNADGRSLAVDHCHPTGRVRGLLCHRCNTGLGLFKDDPARLQRAIKYVTPPAA